MEYLQRNCPLCAATPPAAVNAASPVRAESRSFDQLVPYWEGFFKEKVFFSYKKCQCGMLYAPTFFNGGQLARLYSQMEANMQLVPNDSLRRTQRDYFDTLKRHAKLEGAYLEIGPDVGLFTENCAREGNFEKFWLFEPNRAVWPDLEKAVGGRDHEIVDDMFDYSRIPDGTVGSAVMIQVLDHLLDPLATLKDLRRKMRPGGALAIVVHNESSLMRHALGANWPPFCLQHPQVYSPKSLTKLLEAAEFKVIKTGRTKNHFPVAFLVKHMLWALGLKVENVPALGGLSIGLRLGNMIAIAVA